ncbi:hypothetical protein B9Z55_003678 [Caenorhabditis nigoni]|uniref:F-box domain-containing protein n=1 Tax=Caenorhabditis nigoni TaxID=1611254 RepID=A0A2G5VS70_9PELO|nr:hypothetical protein B9Z55_003678 [Caenorhabditis nigoni]
MPIALLKFPYDLLAEVFEHCDPFELYKLSKCSKRTQRSIKLGETKNWKLQFSGGNKIITTVDSLHYNFVKSEQPENYFKIRNAGRYGKHMGIQIGDPFDVFFYLIDTFRIRTVESLVIHFGNFDAYSQAAKELIERNIEIEEVYIDDTPEVDKIMPVLNEMHVTQKFECLKKFPSNFRHQFEKFPKKIFIDYSFWFTIDQLLECSCVRIELQESMLSNQDLDLFLQQWKKKGSFPNLRWLQIVSKKIDDKSPILGMIPPIENARPRTRLWYGADRIDSPVQMIRDDGIVGSLRVRLANWSTLKFLVGDPIAPSI